MNQPFVVGYKITGTDAGASNAARQVRQEVEALQRAASGIASGRSAGNIDAMLGIGAGRGTAEARADVEAYGNALDDLRAKFVPLFAQERQHMANLSSIDAAYRVGAISAEEQSAAIDRENAAHKRAIAALDGHTHAINMNAAANGRAMAQRANLIFQLNDIFVSLASGMNPAMVAIQQGSQISTIYGPDEGGIGAAFRETGKLAANAATKFWPVAAAAAAIGLAFAGMRHEIEQTSGVAVSFGDTFAATFQVLGSYLHETFRPQIEAIGYWFGRAWEMAVQFTKNAINFIIGTVLVFLEQVRLVHEIVPQAFKLAGELAANAFLEGIEWMVNSTLASVDSLGREVVKLWGGTWEGIGWELDLEPFKRDADTTANRIANIFQNYSATVGSILDTDYAGQFFSDVQAQAVANYNDRLQDTDRSARRAASGLKVADDAAKAFKESMDFYRDTFRSFFSDVRQGLKDGETFWGAFSKAATNALDKIADRAFGMLADGIFDMIVGAFMPGFGQTGGSWGNGLWGSAIFNAKGNVYRSPALSDYRNTIVDQPTLFAFARGAGIMGEAGAEAIMPLARTASGDLGVRVANDNAGQSASGRVEFHLHNYAGVQVTRTESENGQAGRRIDVVLNEAVAKAISTPRGPAQRAMAGAGALVSR